jgi:hypothetical protein
MGPKRHIAWRVLIFGHFDTRHFSLLGYCQKYLTDGEDCLPSFFVHGSKRSTLWLSVTAARCTDDCLLGMVKEKTMSEAFWERIHYAFECTFGHEWMALVKDESRQGGKQTWWLRRGRIRRDDGLDLALLHLIVEQIFRAIDTY